MGYQIGLLIIIGVVLAGIMTNPILSAFLFCAACCMARDRLDHGPDL